MQRSCSTLAYKLPTVLLPTSYLLTLHIIHSQMIFAVLFLLLPLCSLTCSEFFNGKLSNLRDKDTEVLLFISSYTDDLICFQESKLNSSSSFGIPDCSALRSDCTHPGLAFFVLITHTLAAASSFSSGRAYPSLNFLLPLSLCLNPTLTI